MTPRIYWPEGLAAGRVLQADNAQAHYLKTVLRLRDGASVSVFNAEQGEWEARLITGKKTVEIKVLQQRRPQLSSGFRIGLAFAPIRKARLEFMIEKVTELGVTDIWPLLTDYTQHRHYDENRLQRILTEATEQCERLDVPTLHPAQKFGAFCQAMPKEMVAYAALARGAAPCRIDLAQDRLVFIGPEGGFSPAEQEQLQRCAAAISLGANILRAETAAIVAISHLQHSLSPVVNRD